MSQAELPVVALYPAEQVTQAVLDSSPAFGFAVPLGQSIHDIVDTSRNWPAGH